MRPFFKGRRLEQALSLSTTLLVVVLMGTTMLVVESQVKSMLKRKLEAQGLAIAQSIGAVATPALLAYNYAALQLAADGAAGNAGVVYVALFDKEGNLAGIAGRTPVGSDLARAVAPIRGGFLSQQVAVETKAGKRLEVLEVEVPVNVAGVEEPWGRVHVGLSYDIVTAELRRLHMQLFLLGAALAVAAVLAGRFVAGRITAPLRQLVEGTEALARGDLSHRIRAQVVRELDELAAAFNVMVARVEEKARESTDFQRALEDLNATLEAQVHERTRALEESTSQYKSLVEHSPDSILMVQDGKVRFANRAFVETFGITQDDATRADFSLSRIFDGSSTALAEGRIRAWERGEAATPVEVLGQDASGRIRHLELRGSHIEYQGRPAVECLMVDMSEAKRLRQQLSETEKLRALGEMAGGVAHDFNNLLGAILGRAQLLRRKGLDRETDHDLGVIEKAAQDGRETVRRIQEFSRVRRDKRFSAVDLGEILRDAVEITKTRWKDEAQNRNVQVKTTMDARAVPPVLGNGSELREVFTNIILNAVDAMPQGGKLHLECYPEGGNVVCRVTDTGVGMTEDIRGHIFDPFFTTKGARGMGLGMSVVYGIVKRHDGKIDVQTSLGKGTSFHLEFPASPEALRVAGGDGAALPQLLRPGKILVIDDEPEIASVVKDVLAAEGHAVDTAISGREGVHLASFADYDLVFTDLGMPDMSGWEVAEQIRRARPSLPVALVTGWGTSLDEDDAKKRGVTAVVHKPFEIEDLVRTATRLLAQSIRN